MFFMKKKKEKVIIENNKYNKGEYVDFRYKDDLKVGVIREIYMDDEKNISYEINVGGECPYIVRLKETDILRKHK